MDNINLDEYKVKEIIQENNGDFDEAIQHLIGILNDRTIPEKSKRDVRKQLDEIIRLKYITMPMPKIVLEKKNIDTTE